MAIRIKTISSEADDGTLNFLEAVLKQTGKRAMSGASRRMGIEAERIKERAVEFAPVDERGIENSIKVDKEVGDNRRMVHSVYIDGDTISGDGTPVRDYVLEMHEGSYKLGKLSKEKAESSGVKVGRKFLERAVDEARDRVLESVFNEVKKAFK